MDTGDDSGRDDMYFIYEEPWFLRRSDFSSLKLFLYATSWAHCIFLGATDEDEEEEIPTESYVSELKACIQNNAEGYKTVVLKTRNSIPVKFKSGHHIVLSRHSLEQDGLRKFSMRIHKLERGSIVILEPPRIPADIEAGL